MRWRSDIAMFIDCLLDSYSKKCMLYVNICLLNMCELMTSMRPPSALAKVYFISVEYDYLNVTNVFNFFLQYDIAIYAIIVFL